jgi:hypothetical protein
MGKEFKTMFKKFLKSKNKTKSSKEIVEKPTKKILNEKIKEKKELIFPQSPSNRFLTAEGWIRRQKKSS